MSINLPKKPDSITIQLLIRAKLFLDHAIIHSKTNASLDRMIAIHNLDNSVEYLLKIIIRHLEIEEVSGKTLDTSEIAQLAGEINKFLKEYCAWNLPYINEIKLLRQIRNLVQHAMVDPVSDLSKFILTIQKLFEKILDKIFGLKSNEIRISSIIKNEEIKALIIKAEVHIDNQEYLKAVVACRDAFENALFHKQMHANINLRIVPTLLEIKRSFLNLYRYLKELNSQLELESLRIDPRLYGRYEDYMRHLPREYWSYYRGNAIMQRPWDINDAQFCYSFVSEIIYLWEATELEPLYLSEAIQDKYSWIELLGNVDISRSFEGGCEYFINEGEKIKYFFVDKDKEEEFIKNINDDKIYDYVSTLVINGVINSKISYFCKVLASDIRLVTNNPSRWGIMIWMKKIPLTYRYELYSEVTVFEQDCNINKCNIDKFVAKNISDNSAKKIINFRMENKAIANIEDLKHIEDITEKEIKILENYFYSDILIDSLLINS